LPRELVRLPFEAPEFTAVALPPVAPPAPPIRPVFAIGFLPVVFLIPAYWLCPI